MTAAAKTPYYDASKVREVVTGRWLEVLTYLADDQLQEALRKPGKHVTCPIHGTTGKGRGDGFRFFKDVVNTGGGVCNTCGTFHDGFELLMWLKGWKFREALNHVAEIMRVAPVPQEQNYKKDSKPVRSVPAPEKPVTTEAQPVVDQSSPSEVVVPICQPTPERMAEIRAIQQRMAEKVSLESAEAQSRIDRTWYESISLENGVPGPLFRYWKRRGVLIRRELLISGDSLRFHPELPYYDEDGHGNVVIVGKFPALVAAIRDMEGNIVTLHRTYLTPAGCKAKVECPRKMMSIPDDKAVTGAAIQLGGIPKDGVLGVAEGIETAMSAMKVYQIPTWSLVSTAILEKFEPPKEVKTLLIWADKDRSLAGQRVAQALKETLEPKGIAVHILTPQRPVIGKSVDWNDVLVNEGAWGFPAWNIMNRIISGGASWAS